MNVDLIRKYADLVSRKRDAQAKVESFNKELEALEAQVMGQLIDSGVDSIPVKLENGRDMTVYLNRTVYAKPKEGFERTAVVEALKKARLTELISYNANTLSAWVRERLGVEKKPLPPSLAEVLDVEERVAVMAQLVAKRETKSAAAKATLKKGGAA